MPWASCEFGVLRVSREEELTLSDGLCSSQGVARRVVDLRSRLEDAARRFPKGPVRPRADAGADTGAESPDDPVASEVAAEPESPAQEVAGVPPVEVGTENDGGAEGGVGRVATVPPGVEVEPQNVGLPEAAGRQGVASEVTGLESSAESPADGGSAEGEDVRAGTETAASAPVAEDEPGAVAGGTGDSSPGSDAPAVPQPPKKSRRRVVRKRGRAAVTKAAAAAAGTLSGNAPRGRGAAASSGSKSSKAAKKPAARRRSTRNAAPPDPFSVRLRSLEREIEDALQEVGGEGPGIGSALQLVGEQLLGFYAELARVAVDGGIEAAFVRLRMIGTADTVDEFGFDAAFHERALPLLRFLHDRWWRVESTGIRHVPRTGRVMLVGNHSGGSMPYDGLMIAHALEARRAGRGRAARPLVEDGAYHFPFAGSPLARLGVVRASAANAERLLGSDQAIVVFPEGAKGSRKYYRDRYRLQRFARGGFVSLALRTGTPLVPVAVVGAEEIYPVLLRWQWLARVLGVPEFPVTPTFPLLGLLGLIPLPTKWRIVFGAPIDLVAEYGADAYDDELLVNRVKESVRERVQRMLIDALRERDSVFTG